MKELAAAYYMEKGKDVFSKLRPLIYYSKDLFGNRVRLDLDNVSVEDVSVMYPDTTEDCLILVNAVTGEIIYRSNGKDDELRELYEIAADGCCATKFTFYSKSWLNSLFTSYTICEDDDLSSFLKYTNVSSITLDTAVDVFVLNNISLSKISTIYCDTEEQRLALKDFRGQVFLNPEGTIFKKLEVYSNQEVLETIFALPHSILCACSDKMQLAEIVLRHLEED